MRIQLTERFLRSFRDVPTSVRKAFGKQSLLLVQNLNHPSLRAKKFDEGKDVWQARVNRSWRFYFSIVGDTYIIRDITEHPK